jgi:hypothetical protein
LALKLGPFPKLNPEFVVRANPDVIMVGARNFSGMADRPGWKGMKAIAQNRLCVFSLDESDMLVRPGPRMAEAARLMAEQIVMGHPPAAHPGRLAGRRAAGPGGCGGAGAVSQPAGRSVSAGQRLGRVAGRGVALALFGASPLAASPGWCALGLTGAAFVGAVAAVLLTLALARGVQHTLRLLLAGVIVGVVLGALGSLVTLMVARDDAGHAGLPAGLHRGLSAGRPACRWPRLLLLCLATAWTAGPVLDGLALGRGHGAQPGPAAGALRLALVAVLALATGTRWRRPA